VKEAQQWTEGSETDAEKIGRNCKKTQKKHRNRQKSNTAKYQTKTRMEEAEDKKRGRGHRV
jgi:hypothetical protein